MGGGVKDRGRRTPQAVMASAPVRGGQDASRWSAEEAAGLLPGAGDVIRSGLAIGAQEHCELLGVFLQEPQESLHDLAGLLFGDSRRVQLAA